MPSKVTPHHTAEELGCLARSKQHRTIADRLHAMRLAMEGTPPPEICRVLARTKNWYHYWLKRYNEEGLEGLRDRPRFGQPKRLDEAGRQQFEAQIEAGPDLEEDGVSTWNGKAMQARIERQFGVHYSLAQVYRICHELGLSWITPRPQHPKSNPQEQQEFKENLPFLSKKSKRSTRKKP